MKQVTRVFAALAAALSIVNTASAHSLIGAPPIPIHHASRLIFPVSRHAATPAISKSLTELLTRGGLVNTHQTLLLNFDRTFAGPGSLATKSFNQLYRTIVANGVKVGEASVPQAQLSPFTGGTVTGTIQGDLYVLNNSGTPGQYFNIGEFTGTVGTNIPANFSTPGLTLLGNNFLTPNFQNTLNFTPQTVIFPPINSHSGGGGIGGSPFLLGRGSGAQRAFASLFSGLSERSVGLGQQIALSQRLGSLQPFGGGSVAGGLFVGTAYRNTIGSGTYTATRFAGTGGSTNSPLYIFAFGNSPLNNPASYFTVVAIANQPSFVLFGNGLRDTITNGQILYPLVDGGSQNGSVLTFGSNPANNGTLDSVITNLSSFIFF